MDCRSISFSRHAITQMFTRNVTVEEVTAVLKDGKEIETYPDDTPHPSWLLLGKVKNRTLHVVVARNRVDADCIVITTYEPTMTLWEPDYRTRRK